jgi:hypothetical protein
MVRLLTGEALFTDHHSSSTHSIAFGSCKASMSGESVLPPQLLSFVVFLFLPKEEHVFAALDSHKMKC